MNLGFGNYEHQLYIGNTKLRGVERVDLSYKIPERPINILGHGHVGHGYYGGDINTKPYSLSAISGPIEGAVNINGFLIAEDFLLHYTGDTYTTGCLSWSSDPVNYIGFENIYMTQHSVSCSINKLPKYSSTFQVYGDMGSGLNFRGLDSYPEVASIVNQGGIHLNFKGSGTNRVTDFDYDVKVRRSPIYEIGSGRPVQVDINWPIEVVAQITLETDDYEMRRIDKAFIEPNVDFFEITLKDCDNNYIQRYPMSGARLLDYNVSAGGDDLQRTRLTYISFINK
jgi:hypothetical protein|tara:strand:+ start:1502 stop:2350 length:849 start_codon:yes stop_codon:yes gene_type:complete